MFCRWVFPVGHDNVFLHSVGIGRWLFSLDDVSLHISLRCLAMGGGYVECCIVRERPSNTTLARCQVTVYGKEGSPLERLQSCDIVVKSTFSLVRFWWLRLWGRGPAQGHCKGGKGSKGGLKGQSRGRWTERAVKGEVD